MIQEIAYKLYLIECRRIGIVPLNKISFLFESVLYVHEYHDKAKKLLRKPKLKYLLDDN